MNLDFQQLEKDYYKGVLERLLKIKVEEIPAHIRNYAEVVKDKKNFYKGLLAACEQMPNGIIFEPLNWDAIREYCNEKLKPDTFWNRNDYTNPKWIFTTTIAVIALFVSIFKSAPAHKIEVIGSLSSTPASGQSQNSATSLIPTNNNLNHSSREKADSNRHR